MGAIGNPKVLDLLKKYADDPVIEVGIQEQGSPHIDVGFIFINNVLTVI